MIKAIKQTVRKTVLVFKTCVFLGCCGGLAYWSIKCEPVPGPDVRDTKYTREELDQAINIYGVRDCGIAAPVWRGILQVESANGQINHVINLTESQLRQAKRYTKNSRYFGDAISAHGPLQIMGWNALRLQGSLGLSDPPFDDLYRLETAFRASCKILREIQATLKGVRGRALVSAMVERYNGTGPAARDYNRKVMGVVDAGLYEGLLDAPRAPREKLDTAGRNTLLAKLW